jgi:site-specific DNA recombinase
MCLRVINYCRVSSDEQAEHGISLEAQAAKLANYADLFDLEVVATISDAGQSAKSLHRPGMQQALEMLRRGEADGIAVVKLDRLTRNVGDWQNLVGNYFGEKAAKQLWSVQDHIDTTTAMGRLIVNLTVSISAWEREVCGERTKEALQHKIRKGERCGKVRYGYIVGPNGKTLVPVEQEQEAIELMRQLRSEGLTYRAIAAELDSRNIPAKEAAKWSHAAVRQILNRKQLQAA